MLFCENVGRGLKEDVARMDEGRRQKVIENEGQIDVQKWAEKSFK
jgi:hypothetical protein